MKNMIGIFQPASILLVFLAMALASAPSHHTAYRKYKPQPCTTHKPLYYSPVLTQIFISGTYTMKDLPKAQSDLPSLFLSELNNQSPGKYQLANGVTPNLNLYITFTTDNYQHYGAEIHGYVYDGDFYTSLTNNYSTFDKLAEDISNQVNIYITRGWCKNCEGACNP